MQLGGIKPLKFFYLWYQIMKPCNQGNLVGVSLSEPHTSVIAFAEVCVCLPAAIDCKFEMGAFKF